MSRPDALVIEQAEAVARIVVGNSGFVVPLGFKFREHLDNPRAASAWITAKRIMAELFGDDVNTAIENEEGS